jgi:iron(III) transport system substrate-binding protein
MRKLIAVLIVLLAVSACARGPRVVVYSPHGKEMLSFFEEAFEKENPGVDVRWLDMGSQQVLDRLRLERGNPQADVWWGAPSVMFDRAAKEGLLEPYLPSWKDQVDPVMYGFGGAWYGTFLTAEVIAFNTNVVSRASAPRDWDDLLRPEWKGRIVIREPMASGTMQTIFGAMVWRAWVRDGKPDDGYAWLAKLHAQTVSYAADPTILSQKMARGEGAVTLWNLTDIMLQRVTYGYPFDFVVPESGTPVLTEGIALVRGAPHPDLARRFYEFVTSKESAVLQAERFFRVPTRKDIADENLPAWVREARRIRRMEIDWDKFGQLSPAWMDHWQARIRGGS